MCGIAGILRFRGQAVDVSRIETMTNAIAHRGRDSAGIVLGGSQRDAAGNVTAPSYPGLALGHRRLSVIDLAAHSAQPMFSTDRRFCLIYNGELYNYLALREELVKTGYAFQTHSDTEVVLAAFAVWGSDCLRRFNGMFAFVIWDEREQSLFCARDAIGVKPFYYTLDEQGFGFASESRALTDASTRLEPLAVTAYFFSMYAPRHMSIYAGVHKLLPGHSLRIGTDGRIETTVWWQMPPSAISGDDAETAAHRMQALLDRAVKSQLQSDVPVGALLSGGFDSGMIVASAAAHAGTLHTYSVGFEGGVQDSELPIARAMAQRYGTQHHERIIRDNEVMSMLDHALADMSEPVSDSAMVPTWCLSKMAAADGVKVLLSGTGGDEVFAGYSRYVSSTLSRQLMYGVPSGLRRLIGHLLPSNPVLSSRLLHPALDMSVFTGGSPALAGQALPYGMQMREFLETMATTVYPQATTATPDLYRHMQFDLQVYLPDLLLFLLDQLTMAHTVEGRVPLLDTELIAASYALQPQLHADPKTAETRRLMRRMARDRLDPRTFTARKQGFSGPVRAWIAANRETFRERVMSARSIPGLEHLQPERWWQGASVEQNPYWAQEVFLIYCFTTWYQLHGRAH